MSNDPAQELVDVIDDEDRTIGVVTRREMRARRLPHRAVYLLVFNQRGELFIHLRTPTKDVYPGRWDTVAGGVLSAGESYEEGARRELHEELGVECELTPLFPFRYADASLVVRGMVYRVVHDGPFRLQPEEVVCGEFLPLDDVMQRIERDPFCPDGVEVLREYRRRTVTIGDKRAVPGLLDVAPEPLQ
jgi:isopentenyldiphosphate isomerase